MSAAPMAVAEDATKMDYPTGAGGLKVELPFSEMGMKGSGALMTATEPITQTEAKIQSAMSAAPIAIAKDATILDYPANPTDPPIELRKGTNGWSCFPDGPTTPGNDPICLDKTFMKWNDALATGTVPNITTLGLAYMLQGGSDPSNTDPMALEPPAGQDWIVTPPHVMVLVPFKLDTTLIPTDHTYGGPYVMWAGTPYEHIMMPVSQTTK